MLIKLLKTVFPAAMLITMLLSSAPADSAVINLDGIKNAGYWADDLTSAYLYVKNLTDSSYYYQWRYGDPSALAWNNIDDMIADLNTKGVDWWLESGGDPFNNPSQPIWTSVFLEQGIYEVSLAPDSSAYNLSAYWGENNWNAYIQMWADYDDSFNFGEGSYVSGSESGALQFYRANVDGMTISLQQDSNIYFYINDSNSIDNSGSVKLNVTVVPEPGQVALFICGAVPLAIWTRRQLVLQCLKKAFKRA